MPQLERGDIVVERLTGTRVIVISARPAADDVTVRFPDGSALTNPSMAEVAAKLDALAA